MSRPFLALIALAVVAANEQIYTTIRENCSLSERDSLHPSICCESVDMPDLEPGEERAGYAYITVLGGVDNSYKYRGYLYNVAVMGRLFKDYGSEADVMVIIIMKDPALQEKNAMLEKPQCATPKDKRIPGQKNPPLTELPPEDVKILTDNGVKFKYAETMHGNHLDFGSMMFAKSLVWRYTEYRAVQFLDADIMPLRSMDAFFGLSKYTACGGVLSPVNAGWFRLTPGCADYKGLRDLVVEANEWGKSENSSAPHRTWDKKVGWGVPDVQWKNLKGSNSGWTFHGAAVDQGLYYYYFNHVKKDLYQILYTEVNTITADVVETRELEKKYAAPFPDELGPDSGFPCLRGGPTASYVHFTGKDKPWNRPDKNGRFENRWWDMFEDLGTGLKQEDVPPGCFSSPLGYWAPVPKQKRRLEEGADEKEWSEAFGGRRGAEIEADLLG